VGERVVTELALLAAWEGGYGRPPADRAVVLAALASGLPAGEIADLALGQCDLLLLQLREECFGPALTGLTRCPGCGAELDVGIDLGELRAVKGVKKADLAGTITLAPPSATADIWTRRFPDPVTAFASGWMRVRARARQRGVELPLVISDHADWDGLTATIGATGAGEIWVTHGQEDALVHWCTTKGLAARPLDLVGYGDEDEGEASASDDADKAPGAAEA